MLSRRRATTLLVAALAGAALACNDSSSNNPGRDAGDGGARDSAQPAPDAARPDAEAPLPICGTHTGDGVYVKSVSPADKAEHVLRRPTLVVSFEGEISCPETSPLTLSGPAGVVPLTPPPASCGNYEAQPTQDLVYGAAYTLKVAGFVDLDGKPLPACQTSFTVKTRTVAVRTTGSNSLALDEDGTLWIWGDRRANKKELGPIPGVVDVGGKKVVALAVSDVVGLAAVEDGTIYSWGGNQYGQLGRGTKADNDESFGKVQLTLPTGVTITELAASVHHCLALRSDGKVMAWGRNDAGQLADGTKGAVNLDPPNVRPTPYEIAGLSEVVAIAAASGSQGHGSADGGSSLALKKDGTVWGWGSNAFGAIDLVMPYPEPAGYDPRYAQPMQTRVAGATAISSRSDNGYALLTDGTMRTWQAAASGSLGDGKCQDCLDCPGQEQYVAPRTVAGPAGPLDKIVALSAGHIYGLALRADGTVWGWGANGYGQLGDGTQGQPGVDCEGIPVDGIQQRPKQIPIADVVAVAAGDDGSLVLKKDGSVWAAGHNTNNKLGVGAEPIYATSFLRVPGL